MNQWRKDIFLCILVVLIAFLPTNAAMGNMVFGVQHRYGGRMNSCPKDLKTHDANRHGRALVAIDLPLGGDNKITHAALYYTKLSIGTPSKDYYVQVDTGSHIVWVNCANCDTCPKNSSIGLDLNLYDSMESTTSRMHTCDEKFCETAHQDGGLEGCMKGQPCTYHIAYDDGGASQGFFVADTFKFDQVIGNLKTGPTNGTISFGCSFGKDNTKDKSIDRVNGIVGFGQKDTSLISQLAIQGKTKRKFSHCLDGINGGGIFAIGELIETNILSTPLLKDHKYYTVKMDEIEINGETLAVPKVSENEFGRKTVIDSGAILAHLPESVYKLILGIVFAKHLNIDMYKNEQFECFHYSGNIDNDFPSVTFHFKGLASMKVYPHEYFLSLNDKDQWCIGWQRGGLKDDVGNEMILLGEIVLSNKLVVYDLENQTIGWMEYNCSSSIKVEDERSGNVSNLVAHDISPNSASRLKGLFSLFTFLMFAAVLVL